MIIVRLYFKPLLAVYLRSHTYIMREPMQARQVYIHTYTHTHTRTCTVYIGIEFAYYVWRSWSVFENKGSGHSAVESSFWPFPPGHGRMYMHVCCSNRLLDMFVYVQIQSFLNCLCKLGKIGFLTCVGYDFCMLHTHTHTHTHTYTHIAHYLVQVSSGVILSDDSLSFLVLKRFSGYHYCSKLTAVVGIPQKIDLSAYASDDAKGV